MPRIPIDDLDDPRIAVYRSLKATNRTRDLGQFVVEGERLVDRLLDEPVSGRLGCWSPTVMRTGSRGRSPRTCRRTSLSHAHGGPGRRVPVPPGHPGAAASGGPGRSLDALVARSRSALLRGHLPQAQQPGEPRRSPGSAMCSGSTRSWPVRNARTRCRGGCSASRWGPRCGCRSWSRTARSRPPAGWPIGRLRADRRGRRSVRRSRSRAFAGRDGSGWSSATSTRGSIPSGWPSAVGPSRSRCGRAPARSTSPWRRGS